MREALTKTLYFFVDESGDPYFYDRKGRYIVGHAGCSKLLILGFVKTENPQQLRQSLEEVRERIRGDVYLKGIPSVQKSLSPFRGGVFSRYPPNPVWGFFYESYIGYRQ